MIIFSPIALITLVSTNTSTNDYNNNHLHPNLKACHIQCYQLIHPPTIPHHRFFHISPTPLMLPHLMTRPIGATTFTAHLAIYIASIFKILMVCTMITKKSTSTWNLCSTIKSAPTVGLIPVWTSFSQPQSQNSRAGYQLYSLTWKSCR